MKVGDVYYGVFLWNYFVLVNHLYQEFFSVEAILLNNKFFEVFHFKHSRTFEISFIGIVLTFPKMFRSKCVFPMITIRGHPLSTVLMGCVKCVLRVGRWSKIPKILCTYLMDAP